MIRSVIFCAAFSIATSIVQAAQVQGKVVQMFSDYPNFGWCMAKIDFTTGTSCPTFISFGCDGKYLPKSVANSNFSAIQLAFVTGATVKVGVREDLRYNVDFCTGQRVDVLPLSP